MSYKSYFGSNLICLLLILLTGCETEDYVLSTGSVKGQVMNNITMDPVNGCTVALGNIGVTNTDSNGFFEFTNVPAESYEIKYTAPGYLPVSQTITVLSGKQTVADVTLTAASQSEIRANKDLLDFGNRTDVLSIIVSNLTGKTISYTAKSDAEWILIDPQKGNLPGNQQKVIDVSVDRSKISEGHYEKMITIETISDEILISVIVDKGSNSRPTVRTVSVSKTPGENNAITAIGSVVSVGSSEISKYGFCYAVNDDPTLENNLGIMNLGNINKPTEFQSNIQNLTSGKEYSVRAYAVNGLGVSYGDVMTVVIPDNPNLPNPDDNDSDYIVTTGVATLTGTTTAELNGVVAGKNIKEYGFFYGSNSNPSKRLLIKQFSKAETLTNQSYSGVLKDLNEGSVYYYCAYCIDDSGVVHKGSVHDFTTSQTPTITIESIYYTEKGFEAIATIQSFGRTITESGFLYRTDGYDISYTSNYNGKTQTEQCEIENNSIKAYLKGGGSYANPYLYVRAYLVLSDGTIVYNGKKVYAASDYPYVK